MAKPTPVNKPIFFGLRFFQFVTAVIALGIVAYFQYVLWRDGYSIPWEFAILNAACAMTIINSLLSALLTCCGHLSTLSLIFFDGIIITIVWAVGLGTLLRALGRTTVTACTTAKWGNSDGVRICQMYKVLVAMIVLSILLTLAMGILGIATRKRAGGSHQYAAALNPAVPAAKSHASFTSEMGLAGKNHALMSSRDVDTSYGGAERRYSDAQVPEAAYAAGGDLGAGVGREPYRNVDTSYGR